jgi:tetratricopeptide (TPR) repeat protein
MLQRLDDSRAANREALALFEVLVRDQPDNSRWAFGLGWELIRQGRLADRAGDLDTAAQAFRRSAEVQAALLKGATGQSDIGWLDGLATAHGDLAEVESRRGRLAAALQAAESSLAIRQRMIEVSEDLAFDHACLASESALVGELRWRRGDVGGASQALQEAEATLEQIDGMEIEEPAVLERLAATRQRLGKLAQDLGP